MRRKCTGVVDGVYAVFVSGSEFVVVEIATEHGRHELFHRPHGLGVLTRGDPVVAFFDPRSGDVVGVQFLAWAAHNEGMASV